MNRIRCALVAVVLISIDAHANKDRDFAAHIKNAMTLIDRGDREGAVKEFESAYNIEPVPDILRSIADVYRKSTNVEELRRSREYYQRYIEEYKLRRRSSPADRADVENYIGELTLRITELEQALQLPTVIVPIPVPQIPAPASSEATQPPVVTPIPVPQSPPAPSTDAPPTRPTPLEGGAPWLTVRRKIGVALVVGSVVSLAGAVALHVENDQYIRYAESKNCPQDNWKADKCRAPAWAIDFNRGWVIAFYATAATTAVVSGLLLALKTSQLKDESRPRIGVMLGSDMVGITYQGQF